MVRVANALGWLAYLVLSKERRVALTNLDIAFGEGKSAQEKERIACASFQNFARAFLGLFWGQRLNRDTLDKLVVLDTGILERYREINSRGKSILFITLHYGDWELLGLATAYYGIPMIVVAEQTRNPHVERVFGRLRGHSGNRSIQQRFAVVKLFKALKRGGCAAMLIDLNAPQGRGGIWLDFFGMPVFNNSAAAALALHTGAVIVGSVAYPLPDGRVQLAYGPEIPFTPTGNHMNDLRSISQSCLSYCEQVIRERPEYWMWFYKRWKFRPSEERGDFPYYSIYFKKLRLPRAHSSNPPHSTIVPQQMGP